MEDAADSDTTIEQSSTHDMSKLKLLLTHRVLVVNCVFDTITETVKHTDYLSRNHTVLLQLSAKMV